MSRLEIQDLGTQAYLPVYQYQKRLVEKKRTQKSDADVLIFVQHPAVYTYGRKSQAMPSWPNAHAIERGGEATFHNEGQLVVYPVLSLSENERDVRLYLSQLEQTLIDVLGDFGLTGLIRPGATGVWVTGERKIASIGVAIRSWVTYHGCAINICNRLEGFQKIHPCGFSPETMTSMKEQLDEKCPTIVEVKNSFVNHFCRRFHRDIYLPQSVLRNENQLIAN